MAHGFVLGRFKLHLHYLLLSQQMAVGVLELDLGTGLLESSVKFFTFLLLC